jgi:hypothetical protein
MRADPSKIPQVSVWYMDAFGQARAIERISDQELDNLFEMWQIFKASNAAVLQRPSKSPNDDQGIHTRIQREVYPAEDESANHARKP